MGGEIHQSLLTLMKSSAHHYREGWGWWQSVAGAQVMMGRAGMRKDWDGMGEWYFEGNGDGGYRLTLGSGFQS